MTLPSSPRLHLNKIQKNKGPTLAKGFTLMEMLIVVSIIIILATTSLFGNRLQIRKAYDANRKTDLDKLKIALENYYSDFQCYPAQILINNCDSTDLSPYLNRIPCDPKENLNPYTLVTNGSCPQQFQLYTNLDNSKDPDIQKVGCASGCGPGNAYNYGVSSSNTTP